MFAAIFNLIGSFGSSGTKACYFVIFDEPKMPRSVIEK